MTARGSAAASIACGAILAGGRAQRFGGRDKSALLVEGRRVIERQIDVLRAVAGDVMVVANDPAPYAGLNVRVMSDVVRGKGPLGGLYTALLAAPSHHVVVLACDLPFVTAEFLRHMAAAPPADVVVPRTEAGLHPLCARWSRAAIPELRRRLDENRLAVKDALAALTVIELPPDEVVRFDPLGRLLDNVNTEEEYARVLARCAADALHRP